MSSDTVVRPRAAEPGRPARSAGFTVLSILAASLAVSVLLDRVTATLVLDSYQAVLVTLGARSAAVGLGDSRVILVDAGRGSAGGVVGRAQLAQVVESAARRGAWAIGLNVELEERGDPREDAALARACAASGRVVLASHFTRDGSLAPTAFTSSVAAVAATPLAADSGDGRLRWLQHHFEPPRGPEVNSMVVELLRQLAGTRPPSVQVGPRALVVEFEAGTDVQIPVDGDGTSWVQYQGEPGSVPTLTCAEFLADRPELARLVGRAVVIGGLRSDGPDAWLVPFAQRARIAMSGTEVIAQDLVGRLSGDRHRPAPAANVLALRLAALAAGFFLSRARHVGLGNLLATTLWVLFFLFSYVSYGMSSQQAFYPPLGAMAGLALCLGLLRHARATPESDRVTQAVPAPGEPSLRTNDLLATPRGPRLPGFAGRVMEALETSFTDVVFLGAGGMASVYAGVDRVSGQRVAVKVPSEDLVEDPALRQRFMREIQTMMEVSHPNVIKLLGVNIGAVSYYTMELIDGETFARAMVEEMPAARGRALELLRPIAGALAAVHAQGLIHRDLKPSNILIAPDGRMVLTDFGLAFDAARQRMTRTGAVLGTPAYMAPEQIEAGTPTAAVDTYAFGIMLYELLVGERPFTGDPLVTKLMGDAPPLRLARPELDAELEQFVAACLARDPAARPPDGAALSARLRDLLGSADATNA